VVLCDHHYFGGFAGCLALGPICRAAGWMMSQHSNNHAGFAMAAMIHLAAYIPELTLASDTHFPRLVASTDITDGLASRSPTGGCRSGRQPVWA
jgi:glucarate dehydratase